MDNKTVIAKGEPVLYDGQEAWVYRSSPNGKKCWLVVGDGPAHPCEWKELWGGESIRPRPNLNYQHDLGVDLLGLKDSCGECHWHIQCPICGSHYV